MKKIIMVIGLMLFFVSGLFAQAGETYYYKYVETVDTDTGMRSKGNSRLDKLSDYGGKGVYITFTKNSCYLSNSDGIVVETPELVDGVSSFEEWRYPNDQDSIVYSYYGEKNNMYVFRWDIPSPPPEPTSFNDFAAWNRVTNHFEKYRYNSGYVSIHFSKDYKKFNKINAYNYASTSEEREAIIKKGIKVLNITVYEKANPPKKGGDTPDFLY